MATTHSADDADKPLDLEEAALRRQAQRFLLARVSGASWAEVCRIPDDVLEMLIKYAMNCGRLPCPYRLSLWQRFKIKFWAFAYAVRTGMGPQ